MIVCHNRAGVGQGLPLDILHYLISSILPSHLSPIPLTRALLSLSLVSHEFRSIAQPALYRCPFISFDPPDTTPPGQTFKRIAALIETLQARKDLCENVSHLKWLGQWSTRCLSEGTPNRKVVSKTMIKLLRTVLLRQKKSRLRVLSLPFVTMSDKGELLEVLSLVMPRSCPRMSCTEEYTRQGQGQGHEEVDSNDDARVGFEEILFGEGGVFEGAADPWVINLDQRVREEWGVAKFAINDFRRLFWSEAGQWRSVRKFTLMARLRVEDPLEEDDPLGFDGLLQGNNLDHEGEEEEQEKFQFRLDSFELNLLRNSKLSFNYLDRLLHSSRSTLTTLVLKEHQFVTPSTLHQFIAIYGRNLRVLRTTSSNLWDDNSPLIRVIARSCPALESLAIGSACRRDLLTTLHNLSSAQAENSNSELRYLELSNCFSLTLSQTETTGPCSVEGLARVLFGFRNLRELVILPQHASVEDGYQQERNVGRFFRDLDGIRDEGSGRMVRADISFGRWSIEILDASC